MDSLKTHRSDPNPLLIAWMYLLGSCVWIAFSDGLLRYVSANRNVVTYLSISKGFVYVFVTTAVLYVLLRKLSRAKDTLEDTVAVRTAALQESETQYRLLFDSNPLPMWVFDRKTLRFLAVNEAAIRHYGYSREEFLRMTIMEIQTCEEVARVRDLVTRPSRGVEGAETGRHHKKDGSILDVEITSHDLNFRGTEAALILAQDVTERRKSEERLHQSQERFAKAFRSSPFGITISREADGRYLDANPAFLRAVEYDREEIVGRTMQELNIWADPEQQAMMEQQLGSPQHASPLKVRFRARSGQLRLMEVAVERIQLDDESCLLAITHDVTEARQLEQQFLQAQKMEAVGRLAAGVAHDFNNMLGVIIGYTEITTDRLEKEHPAQRFLQEIRKAGDRAVALTRQLLAFSRQQVLEPRSLNLNSVVHHASKMLLPMIGENITLVFRPTEPLGTVHADLSQIEQVLMNLAVNARDAMPKGGKIIIETANVELDETYSRDRHPVKPGSYVMLAVTDTGTGMDEATLAEAFEPFFTTKESSQGTGLGLSTVYGIAKQSNGYVWAYSEVGRGTTFKLYLPCSDEPAERLAPLKADPAPPMGTETVLVAEDEVALRNLTVHVLKSRGYTVLAAEDAARTLALAQHYDRSIDLLLTDVVMPDLTGPDLVSKIRQFRPELKVLYMSGYSKNAMVEQGVLGKDSTLIVKPFSTGALLSKMRAVLES
jgi:two-component system, cell cycle sensor histidine kinase and response regulator CckA